ncbi:ABC transporter substrate-binding protein [Cohnella lubricantis]|uniref:SgrR family transcriptional regulator n=1 Tax=Cohnella lubricantis TaxID=2163172 RepID=A0A841TJK7_9BACL|nr:ABC transporter substrate-binding protein [Cohnella lubricantis]MBB6678681.1 SgrR family transcriptional regulator [Cohnella lubricantis]MBP2118569.1 MarR-like DNA-binding transcriptional regulator SgrR of sgrS sRNA [Cohnella lubricantis]
MELAEHYERLYEKLLAHGSERSGTQLGQALELPIERLAGILNCTERNAKLILRRWESAGWVRWQAGRGRGNRSKLSLLKAPIRIQLDRAVDSVLQGDPRPAVGLLGSAMLSGGHKDELLEAIAGFFRSSSVSGGSSPIDTIRLPTYRPLPNLDPARLMRRTELHLAMCLFDPLVRLDERSNRYVPHLAHHWERVDKERIWRFYLNKGVLFHHGRKLTAEDVRFTLERLAEPSASSYWGAFGNIRRVAVKGDYELEVELREWDPAFLPLLASPAASIVPRDLCSESPEKFAASPKGTGPFRVAVNQADRLVLEAFDHSFRRRPLLDRIEFWFIPQLYESHSGAEEPPEQPLSSFQLRGYPYPAAQGRCWQSVSQMDGGCKLLIVNAGKHGLLQQEEVRAKLLGGIDRDAMIRELGGNRSVKADYIAKEIEELRPGGDADEDQAISMRSMRGRLADGIVDESEKSRDERLTLCAYRGAGNEWDAEWIASAAARLGFEIEIRLIETGDSLIESAEEADLWLWDQPIPGDPEFVYRHLFLSENGWLHRARPTAMEERLTEALSDESDARRRLLLWRQYESIQREAFRYLTLYRWEQTAAYPPEVRSVSLNRLGWVNFENVWLRAPDEVSPEE